MAILKKGLSGEPVRRLQAKLGVTADGMGRGLADLVTFVGQGRL